MVVPNCLLCSKGCKGKTIQDENKNEYYQYDCAIIKRVIEIDSMFFSNHESKTSILSAIFSDILERKTDVENNNIRYCDKEHNCVVKESNILSINIDLLLIPVLPEDVIDVSLINLSRLYGITGSFGYSEFDVRRCLFVKTPDEALSICRALEKKGYIVKTDKPGSYVTDLHYSLGIDGINYCKELRGGYGNMAFIAMAYKDNDQIRDAIKKSLIPSGYKPIIMDEVEYNDQIVPEIFRLIKKARFLLMDCTKPNLGAYYEAGIARGMGKEVIITCRKKEYETVSKPHFDIAQQSMIIWEDEDDLTNRLTKRIECTIVPVKRSH